MVGEHEGDRPGGYGSSPHMKTIALSILVMGVSIALVIVLWSSFGYKGPSFSSNRMLDQQAELRQQYGLPPQPPIPKELLETPPSMRNLVAATGNAANVTSPSRSTAANNTVSRNGPISNQTGLPNGTASNQTASSTAGSQVSIVESASTKGTDGFSPNSVRTKVGSTVTWTNHDSTLHTVTSGLAAKPDGTFDSSDGGKAYLAPGQTFSHTFDAAGDYPYYCILHPNMAGTIVVE